MTEEEARAWLVDADVPRETMGLLDRFVAILRDEAGRQNLVARSTLDQLWSRHIVDSLQLLPMAPAGRWADVGTGAGFPGLVIALAGRCDVTLIEPRVGRATFLRSAVETLGIADRVVIAASRVETMRRDNMVAVLSARAVAPMVKLLEIGHAVTDRATTWLLPKGRSAADELAEARRSWHGEFRLVPSITDPDAAIVVATDVRPRNRR